MNAPLVDQIADAVLYEGYLLYPYRPSVKNRQRWTFGGLYPRAYSEAQEGADPWMSQTECLIEAGEGTSLSVRVRFLHLQVRRVERSGLSPSEGSASGILPDWQEAVEREVDAGEYDLKELVERPRLEAFSFPSRHQAEPMVGSHGQLEGTVIREQQTISGSVEVSAELVAEDLFKATIRVRNDTTWEASRRQDRDAALLRALVSTHTILGIRGGAFLSSIDPPEHCREIAAGCRNIGAWPVLVGEPGERDTMLSAPIILYDYPQVAPESPGDLFDATEIDEILTLRILTLTDDEKRAMADTDDRARALLERTESMATRTTHGAAWHDPGPSARLIRLWSEVEIDGTTATHGTSGQRSIEYASRASNTGVGGRVRIWPLGDADIFDMALKGKVATIAAIEQDYEDRVHVAVTVDDDPGQDSAWRASPATASSSGPRSSSRSSPRKEDRP